MKKTANDMLFLTLLEYHVLHSIGELSADKKQDLLRVQAHLQSLNNATYADTTTDLQWVVAQQQDMMNIWQKYKAWATQRGAVADPYVFAASYVDQNYALLTQGFVSVYTKS